MTCSLTLTLPIHYTEGSQMLHALDNAVKESQGFDLL